MTTSQTLLQVPVRVDAIWSDGTTSLATQTARMENLQNCLDAEQPWLGDTVNVNPTDVAPLPLGMHLHWTLPKGLRSAAQVFVLDTELFNELVRQGVPASLVSALQGLAASAGAEWSRQDLQAALANLSPLTFTPLAPDGFDLMPDPEIYDGLVSSDTSITISTYIPDLAWDPVLVEMYTPLILQSAAQARFYTVPNRWLIVREDSSSSQTAWVLESDRLTAPNSDGSTPDGAGPIALPATMDQNQANVTGISTPADAFSFLGASFAAKNWVEDTTAPRLSPLTAVGNGQPDFAMYYPNCQGIFGFYDPSADPNETYIYSVVGWYEDATQDPMSTSFNVAPWASDTNVAARAQSLSWALVGGDWSDVNGSLFAAQIVAGAQSCPIETSLEISAKVAVGQTPGEALSAYLAKNVDDDTTYGLSAQTVLNAAQLNILDKLNGPDGPAEIWNALHTQGFKSSTGGSQWAVTSLPPEDAGLSGRTAPASVLPDNVAAAVNTLNAAQRDFDLANERLKTERSLLFSDWCRTQHLGVDVVANTADISNPYPNGGTTNASNEAFNDISAQIVQAQANAIDQAGFAASDKSGLLCYNTTSTLYAAHVAAVQALATINENKELQLLRLPAEAFVQPTDPVIMMIEGADGPDLTISPVSSLPLTNTNALEVTQTVAGTQAPTYLPTTWNNNPGAPSDLIIQGVISNLTAKDAQMSWRPVLLRWQTQVSPFPGAGEIVSTQTPNQNTGSFSVTDYATSFIQDDFTLDAHAIDFGYPSIADDPARGATYQSRIALASNALTTVQQQILQFTGQVDDPPTSADELALSGALDNEAIRTLLWDAYSSDNSVLHQALSGFNSHLMMLKGDAQVSGFSNTPYVGGVTNVSFPEWDSDAQSFYPQIGKQRRNAPVQADVYNPIRAGICEVQQLELIDAFGQTRTWTYDPADGNTSIAETLPHLAPASTDAAPSFFLPPRFAQPARLEIHWEAADGSNAWENAHAPEASPICGWLSLNRVNNAIMVYDGAGSLLGSIPVGSNALIYQPGKSSADLTDPWLAQVIPQLETNPRKVFSDLNLALLTVEPSSMAHISASAILESRPLAIARVALSLDLKGMPSPNQSYDSFGVTTITDNEPAMTSEPAPFVARQTCGFEDVVVPVRLGDVTMAADGLVAFWPVSDGAISSTYALVASQDEADSGIEPFLSLTASPNADPVTALLLFDPTAPVHISPTILPVKRLSLPADMIAAATANMDILLGFDNVLTQAEGAIMPLPSEINGSWAWTYNDGGTWAADQSPVNSDDQWRASSTPGVIRSGYLRTGEDNA